MRLYIAYQKFMNAEYDREMVRRRSADVVKILPTEFQPELQARALLFYGNRSNPIEGYISGIRELRREGVVIMESFNPLDLDEEQIERGNRFDSDVSKFNSDYAKLIESIAEKMRKTMPV
jgi:hypothetical protein